MRTELEDGQLDRVVRMKLANCLNSQRDRSSLLREQSRRRASLIYLSRQVE